MNHSVVDVVFGFYKNFFFFYMSTCYSPLRLRILQMIFTTNSMTLST